VDNLIAMFHHYMENPLIEGMVFALIAIPILGLLKFALRTIVPVAIAIIIVVIGYEYTDGNPLIADNIDIVKQAGQSVLDKTKGVANQYK